MTLLGEAIALAADVHREQVDKGGVTYILHPLAVMERATTYYLANSDGYRLESVQIVAVLHDALEDLDETNPWDKDRLRSRIWDLFPADVYTGVEAITKAPKGEETYQEYLDRLSKSWIARIVKIADLSHNMDAFRLPSGKITERDFERWDKYHRALVFLSAIESKTRRPARV